MNRINARPRPPLERNAAAAWGVPLTTHDGARVLGTLRRRIAQRFGADRAEHYTAPPVIALDTVERAGYPVSFPHLLGTVRASPADGAPGATDLVLTPAACHHVYPLLQGRPLTEPLTVEVEAVCFRAEATGETGRLRSFRMYEIVRVARAEEAAAWRDRMLREAEAFLGELGLSTDVVPANDPFFGRSGRLRAQVQKAQELKWEVTTEVTDGVTQAVASANCHKEHFGEAFEISDADGAPVHSACLAFGLDRLLLALLHQHGEDLSAWPFEVGDGS
ncbi:hypothetical protein N566_04790 [Streptomycetaceae bacterium MP113-05]|nr:hypothetical protein N566_04790 [Streptomycetaceae bacterium MP113-05]